MDDVEPQIEKADSPLSHAPLRLGGESMEAVDIAVATWIGHASLESESWLLSSQWSDESSGRIHVGQGRIVQGPTTNGLETASRSHGEEARLALQGKIVFWFVGTVFKALIISISPFFGHLALCC